MDQVTTSPIAAADPNPFLIELIQKGACDEGRVWAVENKITGPAEAWAKLERVDWMLWLATAYRKELDATRLRNLAESWADRALRVHAPAALRSAAGAFAKLAPDYPALAVWSETLEGEAKKLEGV